MGIGTINKNKVFSEVEILASATKNSNIIDLRGLNLQGSFSLHYKITGAGTLSLLFLQSNDGDDITKATDFVLPSTGSEIGTGLTVGSDLLPINMEISDYLIIRATETGGASTATLTANLAAQQEV